MLPRFLHEGLHSDMHSGQQLCLQACILCGTTETPLWRAIDIDGVKHVCNACGLRQNRLKRARRADDAARRSSSNQGRLQLPVQTSSTSYSSSTKRAAYVSFFTPVMWLQNPRSPSCQMLLKCESDLSRSAERRFSAPAQVSTLSQSVPACCRPILIGGLQEWAPHP